VTAIVHVTDLVRGISVDQSQITGLTPVIPGFLRLPVEGPLPVGTEVYVVVKATVQAILPG
jgi:hypothetical protein